MPLPHLKSMPSVFARVRIESSESLHGIDEARRALRSCVAGHRELDAAGLVIPVPVLRVGVGLDAITAHVEPYRGVKRGILAQEDVREFVVKDGRIFLAAEVAIGLAPIADRFGDPGDQLANAGFTIRRTDGPVQVLRGHDVGRRHRPVFRNFDVLLFENDVALRIGDLRKALFPFDLVVGGDARFAEEAAELQAGGLLRAGNGWGRYCLGARLFLCHFRHFSLLH